LISLPTFSSALAFAIIAGIIIFNLAIIHLLILTSNQIIIIENGTFFSGTLPATGYLEKYL
jgi:hypothetical protein